MGYWISGAKTADNQGSQKLVGVPYTVRSFIIYDNEVTLTHTAESALLYGGAPLAPPLKGACPPCRGAFEFARLLKN